MTTLRDALLPVLTRVRAIPGQLGLRPYTVAAVTVTWGGAERGEGAKTTTTTPITEAGGQPPKVRWMSNDELVFQGYDKPTLEVGPITPDHAGGGTSLATLKGTAAAPNSEFYFLVTGPDFPAGARFQLAGADSDRALHYTLRLQRTGDA